MAAYRRVYDSRHLQADCQEPGSTPERYARQSSMGSFTFTVSVVGIVSVKTSVETIHNVLCGNLT